MLDELPFELLSHIYSHLTTAQSVSRLSITCRALNEFAVKEGWKIFLRTRFPSLPTAAQPSDFREAAHGLTTLSRNWDRKGFLSRYIEPSGDITSLPSWEQIPRWNRPQGQTMGYQPCIDSYEEWTSGDWSSRKQILSWSAGTEVMVRVKTTGSEAKKHWDTASARDRNLYFDQYKHLVSWFRYKSPGSVEGRDDITSLNIIRPHQKEYGAEQSESLVFGTANGELMRLDIEMKGSRTSRLQSYTTNGSGVHAAAVSPSKLPLLAVCQAASKLDLYPVYQERKTESIDSLSHFDLTSEGSTNKCRIWSASFISEDKLAVGVGPSSEPLHVYEVSPTGFNKRPLRTFQFHAPDSHRLDGYAENPSKGSSTYSIAPLPASSLGGNISGQVFLSGDYNGTIRLHDLRSPSSSECSYWDSANDSAIYSLLTQGRERIVAGTARHTTVMVYDLRVSGGRAYYNVEVPTSNAGSQKTQNNRTPKSTRGRTGHYRAHYNWNVFLSSRSTNQSRQPQHAPPPGRNGLESPVYSLSLPSASSPTLFAGVENAVIQLDFTGILDAHPDPVFASAIERNQRGHVDVKNSWNPNGDVMSLGMYDKTDENSFGMNLWVQAGVGFYQGTVPGLDERWRDPSSQHMIPKRSGRPRQWNRG